MKRDPEEIPTEEVLRHFRWMRPLARSLVRDAGAAEELVQDSWLAFLKRPPDDPLALATWLRRVLFNFARRRRRADRNRERRECVAARPERLDESPDRLLERAQLHRKVVDLVLALDEPHRSTILQRFFAEMTPREIARREDLPVTTVRSRIARALEMLRARLDREHGGSRIGWCIALASLAGLGSVARGAAASAAADRRSPEPRRALRREPSAP
jgi:RNA polymerase sigma-70 factor (ECF subfamily)